MRKTILLIEPDASIQSLVTQVLEEDSYKVTAVCSLEEAVDLLSRSQFDLIITEAFNQRRALDFNPDLLAQLKALAGKTPIVLFSTYPPPLTSSGSTLVWLGGHLGEATPGDRRVCDQGK